MAKQPSTPGSDVIPDYNTVFIDTSLDTHLIIVVSASETVSDLKKKVLCEHALCFPHIGEIKIHGLKVKRRGNYYYLSESMLVKSVFHGVKKNWFIAVDASTLEDRIANGNFINSLSDNLIRPAGVMNIASDKPALPESRSNPPLLTNVDDNQLKFNGYGDHNEKEKEVKNTLEEGAKPISNGGIFSKPGSIASEERAGKATPSKKERHKRKRNHDEFASKDDNAEAPKYGMHRSEKETGEPESSLGNSHGVVSSNDGAIDGPSTNLSPDAIEGRGTVVQRPIQSERTSNLEKFVELNNIESRDNSVDTQRDQSLKGNPLVEPATKRRRKVKQAEKGYGDLLKDDGTMVFESNKVTLDQSTISQKSLVGNQCRSNATLDGSSSGTREAVDLQLASPRNKKRKGVKKSAKSFNHEAAAVPSMENDGVEHFEMLNNSSNLSEDTAAELACGQHFQDSIVSERDAPNANYPKDKQGDAAEETNLRPSSLETDIKSKEADNLEGGHAASGAAIESNVKRRRVLKDHLAEDNSCAEVLGSNIREKKNKISMDGNEIHNNYQNHFSNQNSGVEKHQNHVSVQNNRVGEEREFSLEFSSKTASSERYKIRAQDDLQLKAKDPIVGSKFLGAGKNMDPPKSSKKRKKSKKTRDLMSVTPSASVTEHEEGFISSASRAEPHKVAKGDHPSDASNIEGSDRLPEVRKEMDTVKTSFLASENMDPPKSSKKRKKSKKTKDLMSVTPSASVTECEEGFISSASPAEPHKVAKGDHPSDTSDKEGSDRLPEVRKEMDTMKTSFLASDKEINDVIQNVVESVQQIGKDQVDTENILGKSRKESRKKQNSDAKLLPDSVKQNENIAYNNAGDMEFPPEVTKQAIVANTSCTNDLMGSFLECGEDNPTENDRGIQSAQVIAQKLDSNSKKRYPEAVISGTPSISGRTNELNGDVDVTCESNGVNFIDYFTPKKQDLENVVSDEMHVVEATKTNGSHGMAKAKKKTKEKKTDAPSDDPSSDLRNPQVGKPTVSNHGAGPRPHTEDSSSAEVEVSLTKENSEKVTLKPNKKSSKASGKLAEPLSSNPHKVNSVPEAVYRSNDAKPTGMVNGSKSKKAEPNLASSNPREVNSVPEEAGRYNDAKPTGKVTGSKSKKAEPNLVSSNPRKVNSVPEEAGRSNDAKPTGKVNGSKSKKAETNLESSKNSSYLRTRVNGQQSIEDHNHKDARKAPAIRNGETVNSSKQEKSLVGVSGSIFKDDSDEASSTEDNDSDSSTRTPSDVSLSSDYSDGESNADFNTPQNGSSNRKRGEGGRKTIGKPFSSAMTLDNILRSSRSYKKAKLTASQLEAEDTESQPLDFVPDSQA